MNNLCLDTGYVSLNKVGEQLCGDRVELIGQHEDELTMVLADGLGSGVKANILSTLTSKILCTMIASEMGIEDCVETMAETLPVCSKRGVAYSTFTIVHTHNCTDARIIQYDNPQLILLRDGKHYDYPYTSRVIAGKTILESALQLQKDDVLVMMSDGAIYAGVGNALNFGWQRDNIIEFLEQFYSSDLSAKMIATILSDECDRLYGDRPGDDTTIGVLKVRNRETVNLIIGPPRNPADCDRMMTQFFSQEGKHVVCGGTTSHIAGEFLGEPVVPQIDYIDPEIPPIAKIKGVDLCTEGVITISKVLEYAKNFLGNNEDYPIWSTKKDGASRICRVLFESATDVNFFVGKAINPAHQNPDLPIGFSIKLRLIEELCQCLEKMGKRVKVSYF